MRDGWIESPPFSSWETELKTLCSDGGSDLARKLGIASRNLLWKRSGHLNKKLFRFPSLSTAPSSTRGATAKTKNFPNRAMSEKAFPIAAPLSTADITLMRRNSHSVHVDLVQKCSAPMPLHLTFVFYWYISSMPSYLRERDKSD